MLADDGLQDMQTAGHGVQARGHPQGSESCGDTAELQGSGKSEKVQNARKQGMSADDWRQRCMQPEQWLILNVQAERGRSAI